MICFKPITLTDSDGKEYSVPCGKCAACLHTLTYEWYVRLLCEFKKARNAFFVTLTYNESSLPYHTVKRDVFDSNLYWLRGDPYVSKDSLKSFLSVCRFKDDKVIFPCQSKDDLQKFFKRLRYNVGHSEFRYFGVSEYGSLNLRPHYHLILFDAMPIGSSFDAFVKCLEKTWDRGFVECSFLNDNRIFYTVKYCFESLRLPKWPYREKEIKPRRYMSKGLGACYLSDQVIAWHKQDLKTYFQDGKRKLKLPRYLRDKIFNDEELSQIQERTALWLLDHNHNYQKGGADMRSFTFLCLEA